MLVAFTCKPPIAEFAVRSLATVCAKLGKLEDVKKHCDDALKIDEKSFKALMRRGMNQVQLKDFDGAEADYKAAAAIQPDSTSAPRLPHMLSAFSTSDLRRPFARYYAKLCRCRSRINPHRTGGGQR